jgi:MFS family permease
MSFFGSMGNDAGFNTWTNDIMTDRNRGQIGAALATQPVLGTILGTVVGGMLVGENDDYLRLFIVMGVFVIVFGVISLLSLNKKDDVAPSVRGSFWQQFVSVFNFKQFFQLKELVWVNVGVAVFFIGFNVYFAYIGNYLIYYLGYTADMMGIIEAVPLVLAMLTAIPIGILINKNKHPIIAVAAIVTNIIGLMILFPVKAANVDPTRIFNPVLWLGIFVVGVGYVGILQTTKVWTKQLYPADAKGQFEGIWILFFVLIPMIGGSLIGQAVVKTSGETFVNAESGLTEYVPNGNVFLVGAAVILLSLIPFLLAARYHKRRAEER